MSFEYTPLEKLWDVTRNNCRIRGGANIHTSMVMGFNNVIGNAKIGAGVEIGHNCVVEDDVEIGENTVLKSNVELRSGTVIGKGCYIDSGVTCTGHAKIGDHVTIRNKVVVARGSIIGDKTFISPMAMFNNLDHKGEEHGGAHLGVGTFVGTQAVLGAGIQVCDEAVIGSCALVTKDIKKKGIYIGCPAKRLK